MQNQSKNRDYRAITRVFQKVYHKSNSRFLKYRKTCNVCGKNAAYIFEEKIRYPADENPE